MLAVGLAAFQRRNTLRILSKTGMTPGAYLLKLCERLEGFAIRSSVAADRHHWVSYTVICSQRKHRVPRPRLAYSAVRLVAP